MYKLNLQFFANIKKINVGGGTYDIYDANALHTSDITQETGDSTAAVMSQNAITNALNNKADASTVTDLSITVTDHAEAISSLESTKVGASKWKAIATCATWSRLCYVSAHTGTVGSKFLLNIRATRNSVVYNDLFVITAHHSCWGTLVKLAGSNYYTTSYKLRVIADSYGNCYVEINDVTNGDTSSTTQEIHCTFIPILAGSLVSYTSFTTGESLPSGFASAAELSVKVGDLQGNLSGNATSATNDSSGNNIVNTYATKSAVSSLSTTVDTKVSAIVDGDNLILS